MSTQGMGQLELLPGPLSRLILRTLILIVSLTLPAHAQVPQGASATAVRAGRLLDPRTGNVLAPAAVLIEGDKIKQVGPPAQIATYKGHFECSQ
jgi:hypothetical protein